MSATAIPRLMTVTEVAGLLRSSDDHIYRLIRRGELVGMNIGRRVLVHPTDLDEFMQCSRRRCP